MDYDKINDLSSNPKQSEKLFYKKFIIFKSNTEIISTVFFIANYHVVS